VTPEERRAAVLRRLDEDDAYFCERALKIVDKRGQLVPFVLRPPQLRFFAALRAQREAGLPERAIILKARQIGFSTATQGTLVRRATRRYNHKARVVAHDNDTAGSLFQIGSLMIAHMPPEIRPEIESQRDAIGQKYLKFGRKARAARLEGDIGLNSEISIDTARTATGGRGTTNHSLHLSEVAFWEQIAKLTGLLNTVPDEPGTLVVVESTANGSNAFKEMWDAAEAGESGYIPFFSPWHEEAAYRLAFPSEEARAEFAARVGSGPWGEDEPRLIEDFALSLEQLNWRRRTIVARCESKLERWDAEYPASPEDAFVATGRTVFGKKLIGRVLSRTVETNVRAEQGLLQVGATRERFVSGERRPVPASALWTPRSATGFGDDHAWWRVWEHPLAQSTVGEQRQLLAAGVIDQATFDGRYTTAIRADGRALTLDDDVIPPGAYVIAGDVAGGEENTAGQNDWHAVQVIDHRTLLQVAEYRSRVDAHLFAEQVLLAALYWNLALVGIETTGGWGIPVIKDYLWRKYGYTRLYRRTPAQSSTDRPEQILGWDTNRRTKPELIAGFGELLRETNDGIRSRPLAGELLTFVRDSAGKTGASHGAHDDRLMAYMIAQQIARIHRPPTPRLDGAVPGASSGGGGVSIVRPRNTKTGY
jgi:hypothetical protein